MVTKKIIAFLKKIITPFEELDPTTTAVMVALQVAIALVWWENVPSDSFFPSLSQVLRGWADLWRAGLFYHITASFKLCFLSTFIATLVSMLVAYSSTIPFFRPIANFITNLRFLPITGFTLFFMTATHGGRTLQVTLLVFFMSLYFITSLMSVIKAIPQEEIDRRKAQKMNRWEILWKVVIKDRLDYLVEIVRQNLSITWMMIVSVEVMNKAEGGLGTLLKDSEKFMTFGKIFALQLTILLIGIGLDFLLKSLFNLFPANRKH